MNRYVNIGLAFGMSAFLGAAAHLSAQAKPETAKPATQKPETAKPATQKPQTAKPATEQSSQSGPVNLGEVRIPRDVRAGGEALPAGTYQVRVTEAPATPQAAGQTPPPAGGYRAEVLKGDDYLRLWFNRGGNHYLAHFNIVKK